MSKRSFSHPHTFATLLAVAILAKDKPDIPSLEQALADAGDDVDKLKALVTDYHGKYSGTADQLATVNHESMTRRQENTKLKNDIKALQDAAKRPEGDPDETEQLRTQLKELQDNFAKSQKELARTQARSAFTDAGASDIDSVELHWNALSDEEKAETTPKDFAETLKASKTHLFTPAKAEGEGEGETPPKPPGFGGSPAADKTNSPPAPAGAITHPQTDAEIDSVWKDFYATAGA